jgi:hypothetical protein
MALELRKHADMFKKQEILKTLIYTAAFSTLTLGNAAAADCVNPETGETDTVVQCFADPCTVTTCEADPNATCTANYCGGCHALFTDGNGDEVDCDPVVACTADAKQCPDGTFVSRDPDNNCEFFPCDSCINPETGEEDTVVQCFADPCTVTTCEADPNATCTANYCGGCHALFTDGNGDDVDCDETCEGDDTSGDSDSDGVCDDLDNDDDNDGVADGDDACPGTPLEATLTLWGCTGEQYVEAHCGTASDYQRRGRFVRCVARASREAYYAGLLTRLERSAMIHGARRGE